MLSPRQNNKNEFFVYNIIIFDRRSGYEIYLKILNRPKKKYETIWITIDNGCLFIFSIMRR